MEEIIFYLNDHLLLLALFFYLLYQRLFFSPLNASVCLSFYELRDNSLIVICKTSLRLKMLF